MVYTHAKGVQKEKPSKLKIVSIVVFAALAVAVLLTIRSVQALPVSGPGNVQVGVNAAVWESNTYFNPAQGLYGILGSGQVNGEFTTIERNGIQIGLRAQERFQGPIAAEANQNGKVGTYNALTGTSGGGSTGFFEGTTWNVDATIDLRNAIGQYKNKVASDYTVSFAKDTATPTTVPMPAKATLVQSSTNAISLGVNPATQGTYTFRLVLTPKTFNGPALAVAIQVNVANP